MKLKLLGVLVLSAWLSSPALATGAPPLGADPPHLDGQALMTACGRAEEAWISFCNGYVQGALDGLEDQLEFYVPDTATRADLADLVYRTLVQSPDLRELRAASVVGAVAMRAYPC